MNLYCMRHGEAEAVAADSAGRALTQRGREVVEQLALYMGRSGSQVTRVLCSSRLRSRQTAEILARAIALEGSIECEPLLDDSSGLPEFLDKIRYCQEDLLFVGHVPFVEQCVNTLLLGYPGQHCLVHYLPATLVCLESNGGLGQWVLNWILSPSLIGTSG